MSVANIIEAVSAPVIAVYRTISIKRRDSATGIFETDWQDISADVKKWGTIRVNGDDSTRRGVLTLDGMRITFQNDDGKYNPNDDDKSFWFGYMDQQRTLVKINSGLEYRYKGADGIWVHTRFPGASSGEGWDIEEWEVAQWDVSTADNTADQIFTGIIAGEIYLSDENEVVFTIKPLVQIFQDFPAAELVGYSTSVTASRFVEMIRDMTDGAGAFLFRPFFGDTTTFWDFSTTTRAYVGLITATAQNVVNSSVWDVLTKIAEAEQFAAYVDQVGVFHFKPKDPSDAVAFEFHGLGAPDTVYGNTIKKIDRFGRDFSNYYSRVLVKFNDDDTSTSYVSTSSAMRVDGANTSWGLGSRTLNVDNSWIADATSASAIAGELFAEYANPKDIIEFTTSFVPHLTILDRISVSYDSTRPATGNTVWDVNDWDDELVWDDSAGDAIRLDHEEFKFLTIEINLDTLECKYRARQI